LAVRIQPLSQTRRSNHRASLAVLFGAIAAIAIPAAIELTRKVPGWALLDAVWAIPFAAVASVAALMFERGARGAIARSLDRAGGSSRVQAARILAVTGICFTLSSSIAVGLYEFLLYKEH